MAKKYIVQNSKTLEVVSVNGCQSARGGRRKSREVADVVQQEGMDIMDQPPEPVRLVGAYNEKNYQATLKRRRAAIQELVSNNFSPFCSAMLTLTFQAEQSLSQKRLFQPSRPTTGRSWCPSMTCWALASCPWIAQHLQKQSHQM